MNFSDLKDLKDEVEVIKAKVKAAQTWLQNLVDSVTVVFKEHKVEMFAAVGVGLVVGAVLF